MRVIHAYAGTQHARKIAAIIPDRGSSAIAATKNAMEPRSTIAVESG